MDDDDAIETLEIDLEVADIGELLTAHGVTPTTELVTALIVRRHRLYTFPGVSYKYVCACGWTSPEPYCTWTDHPEHVAEQIAQGIGLREGYDPARDCLVIQYAEVERPRTIETFEQLDALPEMSIVGLNMGDGNLFAIQKDEGWLAVASPFALERDEITGALEEFGSARVLYIPEADQ